MPFSTSRCNTTPKDYSKPVCVTRPNMKADPTRTVTVEDDLLEELLQDNSKLTEEERGILLDAKKSISEENHATRKDDPPTDIVEIETDTNLYNEFEERTDEDDNDASDGASSRSYHSAASRRSSVSSTSSSLCTKRELSVEGVIDSPLKIKIIKSDGVKKRRVEPTLVQSTVPSNLIPKKGPKPRNVLVSMAPRDDSARAQLTPTKKFISSYKIPKKALKPSHDKRRRSDDKIVSPVEPSDVSTTGHSSLDPLVGGNRKKEEDPWHGVDKEKTLGIFNNLLEDTRLSQESRGRIKTFFIDTCYSINKIDKKRVPVCASIMYGNAWTQFGEEMSMVWNVLRPKKVNLPAIDPSDVVKLVVNNCETDLPVIHFGGSRLLDFEKELFCFEFKCQNDFECSFEECHHVSAIIFGDNRDGGCKTYCIYHSKLMVSQDSNFHKCRLFFPFVLTSNIHTAFDYDRARKMRYQIACSLQGLHLDLVVKYRHGIVLPAKYLLGENFSITEASFETTRDLRPLSRPQMVLEILNLAQARARVHQPIQTVDYGSSSTSYRLLCYRNLLGCLYDAFTSCVERRVRH